MRVCFVGTPGIAVPSLRAILTSRHDVVAVVARPDAPAGRGRHVTACPVAAAALDAGIEILRPSKASDPRFLADLRRIAPDVCAVVAYGGLVPPSALAIPRLGWVNLHFSLLPAWRGAAPVQHAIWHGDDVTGATTFILEPTLDTGPVLGVLTERIHRTDTAGDVLARLAESGATLLVTTLDAMADGSALAIPQSPEGVTFAPKITVSDARVDWHKPAMAVDRQIRACTPAPGSWSEWHSGRIKIFPVEQRPGFTGPKPAAGQLVEDGADTWLVGTGSTPVRLGDVQPQGKRRMPAADWARGARLQPGEMLR